LYAAQRRTVRRPVHLDPRAFRKVAREVGRYDREVTVLVGGRVCQCGRGDVLACAANRNPRDGRTSSNFTRIWRAALEAAGLVGIHFHDLWHTGNTLAAEAGASLRELMDRMGNSSTRAAYIYQHHTSLRDKTIADEISRRVEAEQTRSGTRRQGTLMTGEVLRWEGGALAALSQTERVTGIEPALSAWEADVLPLNYTRAHRQTSPSGRSLAVLAQTSYRKG
jgi:Phage integrase family